jgi:hypothetical protein
MLDIASAVPRERFVLEVNTDKAGHRITLKWEVRKGADCRWRSFLGWRPRVYLLWKQTFEGRLLHRYPLSLIL